MWYIAQLAPKETQIPREQRLARLYADHPKIKIGKSIYIEKNGLVCGETSGAQGGDKHPSRVVRGVYIYV